MWIYSISQGDGVPPT